MDQDAFFNITDKDLANINLNVAPTSGEEYLKQVILSRKRVPSVVVADIRSIPTSTDGESDVEMFKTPKPKTFSPPTWWAEKQCWDFSRVRQKFKRLKARAKKHGQLKTAAELRIPNINNENAWKTFCFGKCSDTLLSSIDATKIQDVQRVHSGTPPLLTVLFALDQPHVIDALEFHTAWFADEGYSEARMQWLYALLCLVEKPLGPEICSTMRDLAKHCAQIKQACINETNDVGLVRICDWFICIVANYFEQKDLINL